jgi:hypothetical protein
MLALHLSTVRTHLLECIWLRHYATSRKVSNPIPDDVIGLYSAYNEWVPDTEIQMFMLSGAQPMREADNLTVTCEPTV